jgi:hypothetical protein
MSRLLPALLLFAGTLYAGAQGQINFRNSTSVLPTPPDRLVRFFNVPGITNGAPVEGTNYVAQLFFAADAANLDANSAVAELPSAFFAPGSNPGVWDGGTRFLLGASPGQIIQLIVRVWDLALFATYADSETALGIHGQSLPFTYIVPNPGDPEAAFYMLDFQGFNISPVPEPSAVVLAVLGMAWLGVKRRNERESPGLTSLPRV